MLRCRWYIRIVMTRSHRKISCLVLIALLFAQFATAAYACAGGAVLMAECDGMQAPSSVSEAAAVMMMADPAHPALCAEHCGRGAKVQLDAHAAPALLPPALSVLLFALVPAGEEALLHVAAAPGFERSHAPPVPILLGRFLS